MLYTRSGHPVNKNQPGTSVSALGAPDFQTTPPPVDVAPARQGLATVEASRLFFWAQKPFF
jgi:hypothetical protein